MSEWIQNRGLEKCDPVMLSEIAKAFSKTTNCTNGGYGFYAALEKHVKTECHQGRINFLELTKIVENLFLANIGSNEFHQELE